MGPEVSCLGEGVGPGRGPKGSCLWGQMCWASGRGLGWEGVYSEVQYIMGNGHIKWTPPVDRLTDRQTHMKILPSATSLVGVIFRKNNCAVYNCKGYIDIYECGYTMCGVAFWLAQYPTTPPHANVNIPVCSLGCALHA